MHHFTVDLYHSCRNALTEGESEKDDPTSEVLLTYLHSMFDIFYFIVIKCMFFQEIAKKNREAIGELSFLFNLAAVIIESSSRREKSC